MEDLQEFDRTVKNDLDYIEYELKRITKKRDEDKSKALKGLSNKIRATQKIMTTYEMQMSITTNQARLQYNDKYQSKVTKLTELNIKIKEMKRDLEKNQFLADTYALAPPDKQEPRKEISQMNQQELIQFGNNRLDKADERLDEATRDLMNARDLNKDIQEVRKNYFYFF